MDMGLDIPYSGVGWGYGRLRHWRRLGCLEYRGDIVGSSARSWAEEGEGIRLFPPHVRRIAVHATTSAFVTSEMDNFTQLPPSADPLSPSTIGDVKLKLWRGQVIVVSEDPASGTVHFDVIGERMLYALKRSGCAALGDAEVVIGVLVT